MRDWKEEALRMSRQACGRKQATQMTDCAVQEESTAQITSQSARTLKFQCSFEKEHRAEHCVCADASAAPFSWLNFLNIHGSSFIML
jgi:hypothetical protein